MPQQLTRLFIVFGLLVAALVAARHFLVPKTFGQLGHYRAAAVDGIAALPIKYAGREVCATCHDDIAKLHGGHGHANVACEVCHGPAAAHVNSPLEVKLPAPRERARCPLCHGYDPSRRRLALESLSLWATEAGKPITVWVNPDNPSESMLDRELRWKLLVIFVPFALGFGGVGLVVGSMMMWNALGLPTVKLKANVQQFFTTGGFALLYSRAILVQEAGGVITDWEGGQGWFETGNLVVGNPGVQRELQACLHLS